MKSPMVTPMANAIITPPMSIPLPSAVIPLSPRDQTGRHRQTVSSSPQSEKKAKVTHGYQEEDTRNHGHERRSAHLTRIQIAKNTSCEGANRRDDIGAVEYEVIGYFVNPKRRRGDDGDHIESIFR